MSTPFPLSEDQLEPLLTITSKKQHQVETQELINKAWSKLAPFWPIKEFVGVNPLQGFIDKPIEEALVAAESFFQQEDIPEAMHAINRETIKWCQAFFDEGQAVINMPNRKLGLYQCWKRLAIWDKNLHGNNPKAINTIKNLPDDPQEIIIKILSNFHISQEDQELFLTLMLTTLPGWAAHVKYRSEHQHEYHPFKYKACQSDYLALRMVITEIVWSEAADLVQWHKDTTQKINRETKSINDIKQSESEYHTPLLKELSAPLPNNLNKTEVPDAQLVFCIDVRSDPIRKSIESLGNYETFGYAGFFGLPIAFQEPTDKEVRPSCPVIVQSEHVLKLDSEKKEGEKRKKLKNVIQLLKYNFTTSLAIVELLGAPAGLWMALQNFFPTSSSKIKHKITEPVKAKQHLTVKEMSIPFENQCIYAETALKTMGMTDNFAPLVIFCGHGSKTENNALASSLDCGACGGRSGIANAKVICQILNSPEVREKLKAKGIDIKESTLFVAGEHNTTTNEIQLFYSSDIDRQSQENIQTMKKQLELSKDLCNAGCMGLKDGDISFSSATKKALFKSSDWAQTRPEWGLAKNAALIVGPRSLTKNIELHGRSFLQSYEWKQDCDGELLESILKGPLNVAHWINSQYLFSSLDNVAYGSGSKVTKNITGKIGIIQGNGSDLMHGLPLQSVNEGDKTPYHRPCRLMSVIFAPHHLIEKVLQDSPEIRTLIKNGWVRLFCIDPIQQKTYKLDRKMQWRNIYT
ncbi:MAG: putative inorganic carbon transporter subunit DabA [Chlamydiota bacterium]